MKITKMQGQLRRPLARRESGMTLVEVVIAMMITGLTVSGVVMGYTYCANSAEKTGLSLAASARAIERMEEIRSAKWDTASWPVVDQLVATNFPKKSVIIDLSGTGKQTNSATILTTISQISASPPLRRVKVDCVWTYKAKSITNSIETCRAPDQ